MYAWLSILTILILGAAVVVFFYLKWVSEDLLKQEQRLAALEKYTYQLIGLCAKNQETMNQIHGNFSEFCEATAKVVEAQATAIRELSAPPLDKSMN